MGGEICGDVYQCEKWVSNKNMDPNPLEPWKLLEPDCWKHFYNRWKQACGFQTLLAVNRTSAGAHLQLNKIAS